MEQRTMIVLGVVAMVAVAAVVLLFPTLAQAYTRVNTLAECDAIESRISDLQRQDGGDVAELAILRQRLVACLAKAKAAGANFDPGAVLVRDCAKNQVRIDAEYGHLKTTDMSDILKRNNTRGTMLRLGSEMVACFAANIPKIETLSGLYEAKQLAVDILQKSLARATCYRAAGGEQGGEGCGRYPLSTEPHGNDKADAEVRAISDPMQAVIATLNTRIAEKEAENRQQDAIQREAVDKAILANPIEGLRYHVVV